jgi:hypothetical protein
LKTAFDLKASPEIPELQLENLTSTVKSVTPVTQTGATVGIGKKQSLQQQRFGYLMEQRKTVLANSATTNPSTVQATEVINEINEHNPIL